MRGMGEGRGDWRVGMSAEGKKGWLVGCVEV